VPFIFISDTLGEGFAIVGDRASVHRALRDANERDERRRAEALLAGESGCSR